MTADRPATEPRTDSQMAEYVRSHQCWNADPYVTVGDWHRGILAIEAEARDAALREQTRITVAAAVRLANHGKSQPPNDPCGSCAAAVDEVLAALPRTPGEDQADAD